MGFICERAGHRIWVQVLTIRHLALRLIFSLKFFWLILLGVVLARALTAPGDLFFKWDFIAISYTGLTAG